MTDRMWREVAAQHFDVGKGDGAWHMFMTSPSSSLEALMAACYRHEQQHELPARIWKLPTPVRPR